MKKENLFTLSEEASTEYSASVVKIGDLEPIEGSDYLVKTIVDGYNIVVRKDEVKTGDLMIYCRIETVLNKDFLSANNLFELHERELNSNYKEVQELIESGKEDEAKKKVGFFNKHGRVKMVKLRGCPSLGFLFTKESLVKWDKSLADIDLEDYLDIPYWDTIGGKKFIKVYVPYVPEPRVRGNRNKKAEKRLKQFNRLVPGEFKLHYETSNLNKEITNFSPEDKVSISVKLHGTSICIGNVKTKKPENLSPGQLLVNKCLKKNLQKERKRIITRYPEKYLSSKKQQFLETKIKPEYTIGYDVIYSSRTVIKNQFINKGKSGFYKVDVWTEYYKLLKNFIPEGYELFGEIIGYENGSTRMIQKNYDYGCEPGTSKMMIYRISVHQETGKTKELDVPEVLEWTLNLLEKHPELKPYIHPIDLLWNGTLQELYPNIDPETHWHANVLEALKTDKERFGMELLEPMCKIKVPREGIVLRKDGDPCTEAWKLKTIAFLGEESKRMDKGEVDQEMLENYK